MTAKGQEGYVLVSLLWLLGLLGVALAAMSFYTVSALSVMSTGADRVAGEALTRAGVESAALQILRTAQGSAVRGTAQQTLGGGSFRAIWRGENGKIDVNLAPPALLMSLFAKFGDNAETWTNEVMRRRGNTTGGGPAAPNPGVAAAPAARALPFRHVRELATAGLPEALVTRILPYVTVYGGSPKIDPRLAAPGLLALLPEMSEPRLRRLTELLEDNQSDPAVWQQEAGPTAAYLSFDRGPTVRLRVEATLDNGFKSVATLVMILYQDDAEPYRVLSWDDAYQERNATPVAGEDP